MIDVMRLWGDSIFWGRPIRCTLELRGRKSNGKDGRGTYVPTGRETMIGWCGDHRDAVLGFLYTLEIDPPIMWRPWTVPDRSLHSAIIVADPQTGHWEFFTGKSPKYRFIRVPKDYSKKFLTGEGEELSERREEHELTSSG
jgi:hypothetical protein